jgi:uncharacterized protein YutE (UPF0331/DUF86 family)
MYVVSRWKLGVLQDGRDAFSLLHAAGILLEDLAARMQRMVGFRDVAVPEYTRPNLEIIQAIVTKQPDDFRTFSSSIVKAWA